MRQAIICIIQAVDMCQCPIKKGRLYLTGVNHIKAHYTQFKDSSGIHVGTMKNVAVGTNLRIYH